MKGDFTRATFKPERHYHGVLKQQGRVDLDADWNEQEWITSHRIETETVDVVGPSGAPMDHAGFQLTSVSGGSNLNISAGRGYVDGILCENENDVLITAQPDLPGFVLPTVAGVYIAFLDVWLRHIISLDDSGIREVALGGPDTCTRAKVVWQVGLVNVGAPGTSIDCVTDVMPWTTLTAPSTGTLAARAEPDASSSDPCVIPAKAGYRRLENQLYRVEIHDRGSVSAGGAAPTFKWSRDNGSLVTSWTGQSGNDLTVTSTGPDSVLGFAAGQWVELTDDTHDLTFQPGTLVQLVNVEGLTLTINPASATGPTNIANFTLNPRIRRWDSAGSVAVTAGTWLVLEDGVQVEFGIGTYLTGDYWLIPARTLTADVEWPLDGSSNPIAELPKGIRRHFCRLAILQFDGSAWTVVTPCLPLFPPLTNLPTGEGGCDCTVCVTADSHNSGKLTLNKAIAIVQGVGGTGGGKICLGPGVYDISETVTISNGNAIQIAGHGLPLLQATANLANNSPLILINNSLDIAVEDISLASTAQTPSTQSVIGIAVRGSTFVYIRRCAFASSAGGSRLSQAISFGGRFVTAVSIQGNFFNGVQVGIGFEPGADLQPPILGLSIEQNDMQCTDAGVMLSSLTSQFRFAEVRFAENSVQSAVGVSLTSLNLRGLDVTIERNTFVMTGQQANVVAGIICNASQTRIVNNEILGDGKTPNSNGIAAGVPGGKTTSVMYGVQITGNHISTLTGSGILVLNRTLLLETIIAKNQLLNLGKGGIVMELVSSAVDLNITGNTVVFAAQDPNAKDTRQPLMVGIQLLAVINAAVTENVVENIGLTTGSNIARVGILLWLGIGTRFVGNRILNIGPTDANSPINPSSGLGMLFSSSRVDIHDNEVRRALPPPASFGNSKWNALALLASVGELSIHGNLFESFGTAPTVTTTVTGPCVFSDNQCRLDNPDTFTASPQFAVQISGQVIIASANYVLRPKKVADNGGAIALVTAAAPPTDPLHNITVLGNATSASIFANGTRITNATVPWGPLNIIV
jgi:hypothetical protein